MYSDVHVFYFLLEGKNLTSNVPLNTFSPHYVKHIVQPSVSYNTSLFSSTAQQLLFLDIGLAIIVGTLDFSHQEMFFLFFF